MQSAVGLAKGNFLLSALAHKLSASFALPQDVRVRNQWQHPGEVMINDRHNATGTIMPHGIPAGTEVPIRDIKPLPAGETSVSIRTGTQAGFSDACALMSAHDHVVQLQVV